MSALHITNGDCAADKLRLFLRDPVTITADPLWLGPVPEGHDDAWYDARARHLASSDADYPEVRASLEAWDRTIASAADNGGEIVLWFEHDLFDQLLLIRVLSRLAAGRRDRVSMICIDRFPGVDRFIGLGQLAAAQLATLAPARQPVSPGQFDLAVRAWSAFRSRDPRSLLPLAVGPWSRPEQGRGTTASAERPVDTSDLPFLSAALRRFLEEFPSTIDGLSRTARLALQALEDGPRDGGDLFIETQAREQRPFIGDCGFFDVIRGLAEAPTALVTIVGARPFDRLRVVVSDGRTDLRRHQVAITAAGREVVNGRADAVALNGIDEWRGGVHLRSANGSLWRWDAARETLVQ